MFLDNQQVSMFDCLVLATFFLFSHFKEELTSQSFLHSTFSDDRNMANTSFNSSQHYTRGNATGLLVSITITLRVCIKIVEPVWTGGTLAPSYPTTAITEVLNYAQLTNSSQPQPPHSNFWSNYYLLTQSQKIVIIPQK